MAKDNKDELKEANDLKPQMFVQEKEAVETTEEVTAHKVLVQFTLDKPLIPGNTIYLPKGKLKYTLISNKLIK